MFNSIGLRIQIWYLTLLVLVVSSLLVAVYQVESARRTMEMDRRLDHLVRAVLPRAGGGQQRGPRRGMGPSGTGRASAPGALTPDGQPRRTSDTDEALLNAPDVFVMTWDAADRETLKVGSPPSDIVRKRPADRISRATTATHRESLSLGPRRSLIWVGIELEPMRQDLAYFATKLVLGGIALVGAVGVIGFFVVRRGLRPVSKISATAKEIAQGDLSRRISARRSPRELSGVISTLNETFEKLESSFHQQEQFTANASHELRTPLTVILGQSQRMLKGGREGEDYRAAFEICESAGRRMKRLVDELTELSRFDSGQGEIKTERFDLESVVTGAMKQLGEVAIERGVVVKVDTEAAPCEIDPDRIEQVVTNLVTNSWLHNASPLTITIRTGRDGNASWLSVEDDGNGIPEDQIEHIFDRFFRTDDARGHDHDNNGSGLGLSICRAIIEAHNGTITAENLPEGGCRTTVRINDTSDVGTDPIVEPEPHAPSILLVPADGLSNRMGITTEDPIESRRTTESARTDLG